jgi:Carbohydrate-binding module 48 (Isoamylase N-terminal domain)
MSDREVDPFIEQIASELRRPVRLDARFDDRVMAAIESPEVIPLRPTLPRPWIMRPWTISVSPLGTLAMAAAVAGFIALGVWRGGAPASSVAEIPSQSAPIVNVSNSSIRTHQFLIVVPDAKKMVVVGDFNGWDATQTPMVRVNDKGLWSVSVPLRAGKLYQFQYVKDDTLRLNDPSLPQVSSDFGSPNSALTIPAGPR